MLNLVVFKEFFDAEVTRAVFWTWYFLLNSNYQRRVYPRCYRMTPECVTFLLKGNVARVAVGDRTGSFSLSIKQSRPFSTMQRTKQKIGALVIHPPYVTQ